jgi:type 2 lantibiotic biosynthesis protein LanM
VINTSFLQLKPNQKMSKLQNEFLEAANYLGAIICRDALWAGDRCNWLGPSMEYTGNSWGPVHKAYGPELYSGTSGIALFLTHLYAATNEKVYRSVAKGALTHCLSRVNDIHPLGHCGFYAGWTGIAHALLEATDQLGDEGYTTEALRLLKSLTEDDPNEQGIDVIAGSAGAIPLLLDVHRKHSSDFLVELATSHGEHLLATATKNDFGWSWNTMGSERDLTGFSHGAAGIGWALLELHHQTGEARFREAAEEAFRYERYYYNVDQENWPDFRSFTNQNPSASATTPCGVAWCHGAPGIGLSRLRAYELTGDEQYREEAEAAIRTAAKMLSTVTHGKQDNFSLCHGLTGNAELLIYASEILGDSSHLSLVNQIGESGIEYYRKAKLPWPCGVPQAGESPNLMLGLAGIGYFYLRLFDSAKHRPVLMILPR